MGGGLQLTVQTEERLDPAEAEILMRKIALIERTGSKSENIEDLKAQLRYAQRGEGVRPGRSQER